MGDTQREGAAGLGALWTYRLLAHAIAGRPLDVQPGGPKDPTFTDGRAVYVRAGADPRIEAAIQASLVAAGSLDPHALRPLVGRPRLASRYLALEGRRAVDDLAARLPGLAARLAALAPGGAPTGSAAESLALARSAAPVPPPPLAFGALKPRRILAASPPTGASVDAPPLPGESPAAPPAGDAAAASTEEPDRVIAALEALGSRPHARAPAAPVQPGAATVPERGTLARLLAVAIRGGGPLPHLLRRLRSPVPYEGGGVPDEDLPAGERPGPPSPSRPSLSLVPLGLSPGRAPLAHEAGVYPEWDEDLGTYRARWCTVLEVLRPDRTAPVDRPPADGFLRRRLGRLGLGLGRVRRQAQGEELDIDAVVECRAELAAGSTPDENVYVQTQRRRRDLAALVLLDVSGSAAEPSPAGGTVHDRQRAAAASLVEALHLLGDRVACYAFFSHGRAAVRLVRVKSFDEPFGGAALERFGGLQPRGFTRLGAAIRHATHLLETRGGRERRLLLVLSDGVPYDHHRYEGPYGEADARRALAEARERGVGCACLTIGGTGDPAELRRVFGSAAHASARSLEDLRDALGPLFRQALRHAGGRRAPLPGGGG